jgi:Fe2+ or Zn2+ uptake regulation protein
MSDQNTEPDPNEKDANLRYVRTAQFRADAVAFINKAPGWLSSGQVLRELQIADKMNYISRNAAYTQLRNLANSGLVRSKKEGKDFYYAPNSFDFKEALKEIPESKIEEIRAEVNKAKKDFPVPGLPAEPDIKLDVVKSTGKVRLTVGGMLIEIGVVEK